MALVIQNILMWLGFGNGVLCVTLSCEALMSRELKCY